MKLSPHPVSSLPVTGAGLPRISHAGHDEVLADIAHGLQTPLAALYAHLSLTSKKHPRNRHLKVCMALAEDMSGLVKDLVRLARTDSTVQSSVKEKIDVGEMVESIIEYMGVLAQSKGIELTGEIEREVHVCGAPKQLEEVLMNLINNSIKYIDASMTEHHLIRMRVESTDTSCVITIRDTGIGIDPDELPYVFTRFYRTRAGSARAPGSGLGLAIAKKTIEAHGGSIALESAPGKGTCVSCTLPLHEPRLPFSGNIQASCHKERELGHIELCTDADLPPRLSPFSEVEPSFTYRMFKACERFLTKIG